MNDPYQTRQFFDMKQSELKEIIRKEVRKAIDESQGLNDFFYEPSETPNQGLNKFRTPKEQEYEVGYWEYTAYGPETGTIEVMATSKEDAIEKAEGKTRGKRGSYKVIAIDGEKV